MVSSLTSKMRISVYHWEFLFTIVNFCLQLGISVSYSEFLLTIGNFCVLRIGSQQRLDLC